MASLIELIIELFSHFVPDRSSKYGRIQALGFLLSLVVILAALLFFFGDHFELGSS